MSEENLSPQGDEGAVLNAETGAEQHQEGSDNQEQHDPVERVAKAFGWKPKEQHKGPDGSWQDAETFLSNTPKVMDDLRQRVTKTTKATERIIAETKRRAQREAEERIRQAVELNDPDAALAAAREIQTQNDDPAVEWADSRPWFKTDEVARAVAIAAAERAARAGSSPEEQLEEAEAAVRRRFPEYFEETKTNGAKPGKQPAPVVAGGQRASSGGNREKGWADLPAAIRADPALKRMIAKGDFTETEYAKQWHSDNKENA